MKNGKNPGQLIQSDFFYPLVGGHQETSNMSQETIPKRSLCRRIGQEDNIRPEI